MGNHQPITTSEILSMSEPHSPACFADRAWFGRVILDLNERIARDTYQLSFSAPQIAARIVPGQFIMLRLPSGDDPLLGRPLAVYDVTYGDRGEPLGLEIVYLAVGKMTRRLAELPRSTPLDVWGPLGNGFPAVPAEHLVMVAGGIGQTPFLAMAKEHQGQKTYGDPPRAVPRAKQITLCYGARSADHLAGVADFQSLGIDVRLATDDGSTGHHGLVTDLIAPLVSQSKFPCRIVCCGPEKMIARTAQIAAELGVPCQVSLETPMACGIGICFSCVTKVLDASGGWDYRRTCVEGPVFDAEKVVFGE
jgi:dihydroorotate dehydrogenase electron transfer subunit